VVTITKYLVLFIAASLILPYFGCHIFTSAPTPEEAVTTGTRRPARGLTGQAPAAIQDTAEQEDAPDAHNEDNDSDTSTRPQTGGLNDIQQLLGE